MRIRATFIVEMGLVTLGAIGMAAGVLLAPGLLDKSIFMVLVFTFAGSAIYIGHKQTFAEALVQELRMIEGESQIIAVPRDSLNQSEMLHILIQKADMRLSLKEYFHKRDDFKVTVYVNEVSRKELTLSFVQDREGNGGIYEGEVEHYFNLKELGIGRQDKVAIQIDNPFHKIKVRLFAGVRMATYFASPNPRRVS